MQPLKKGGDNISLLIKLGETREVFVDVEAIGYTDNLVTSATYEICNSADEVLFEGTLEIDGNRLSTMFTPTKTGFYTIIASMKIGAETVIRSESILVTTKGRRD